MPRRKRQLLDDDDSDSSGASDIGKFNLGSESLDAQEERALFENPYQHKKRRRNLRDDGSEDEGTSGNDAKGRRNDWTKAPSFVSGESVHLTKPIIVNENSEEEEDQDGVDEDGEDVLEESDSSIASESSRPPSPPFEDGKDDDERPKRGGIGSRVMPRLESPPSATYRSSAPSPSPVAPESLPSSFGAARTQRSFLRDAGSSIQAAQPPPLTPTERAHFGKLQGTFGARMLAKMGWQTGTGLGVTGEGIVTPIDQKQRPGKIGIAYRGFKEKTEQSKAEARRRGEVVSDDEDTKPPKGSRSKTGVDASQRSDAWKKPKKVNTKVVYKTYEQIVAEAVQEPALHGIGKIIDATGAIPREVSSLAEISMPSWTPSTDPTRLPEVRHNLRLITDVCKNNLDGLAREAKALEERKKWIADEDVRLRKKAEEEANLISRLQQVHLVAKDISDRSKELASVYEASLDSFSPYFRKLLDQFACEFDKYRLDEVVVAAIIPLVRRVIAQWKPLEEPDGLTSIFRIWRQTLKLTTPERRPPQSNIDVYGIMTISTSSVQPESPMTPFESLLWNVWLPRIRSCINHEWSPQDPHPAVKLYETWFSYLPQFIRDNFLDQLILPKVQKAVADWNPRKDTFTLQTLVFPWLPHVGLRFEEVIGDARRKFSSLLRGWVVSDMIPKDLVAWQEVFNAGEWDAMMLKNIVPKLAATLRDDFRIYPRNQNMEPLRHVLLWSTIIRASIFSRLLETEFFTKWLDVLHVWLIQPRVSFDEVAKWYTFWKEEAFPEDVQNMPGVSRSFTRGLQLMNKAIELGPDAPTQLAHPDLHLEPNTLAGVQRNGMSKGRSVRSHDITFRSIVEDFTASHNLLLIPTGRAHETSRMPLFRVSPSVDGKRGLLVYISGDAVWASTEGSDEYRAISLDDMVSRANA